MNERCDNTNLNLLSTNCYCMKGEGGGENSCIVTIKKVNKGEVQNKCKTKRGDEI
jgi:hypothetical protein